MLVGVELMTRKVSQQIQWCDAFQKLQGKLEVRGQTSVVASWMSMLNRFIIVATWDHSSDHTLIRSTQPHLIQSPVHSYNSEKAYIQIQHLFIHFIQRWFDSSLPAIPQLRHSSFADAVVDYERTLRTIYSPLIRVTAETVQTKSTSCKMQYSCIPREQY